MKTTNKEDIDNLLSGIQQVNAPDFLYTRIEQQIRNKTEEKITPSTVRLVGFAFVFLIGINVIGISKHLNKEENSTNLLNQFNLESDFNLYK